MKQALVGQGTDREQGNSHLEWASQPPPFLVVPEKKLPDPDFKTLMPMMTRGKTKMGNYMRVCVCPVAKLCLTLCNPVGCSLPGSSVHGTFQTRILEWVVISSSRGSSQTRDKSCVSCTGRWILCHRATRKAFFNLLREKEEACRFPQGVSGSSWGKRLLHFPVSLLP